MDKKLYTMGMRKLILTYSNILFNVNLPHILFAPLQIFVEKQTYVVNVEEMSKI